MGRPIDKHIDNEELNALVPSVVDSGQEPQGLSADAVREAESHVQACRLCSSKVAAYRQCVDRSNVKVPRAAPRGTTCPRNEDVDWYEVAAGLWPELKARQLIMHASKCDHCGPLLHAAVSVDADPSPEEERFLAQLQAPSRPDSAIRPVRPKSRSWPLMRWLAPAFAMVLIVTTVAVWRVTKPPLSGKKYAEFAVNTHRQYAAGTLPLDVKFDSQQDLNEWFKTKVPFSLALPASPPLPGEQRPYRLQGARLVPAAGKTAVYIAYQMQSGPASLMVTADSVADAAGGVVVGYKKVSFHYRTVQGYKVVTWSLHGKSYALVSQEGNSTQRSCMVCHSAMRDRDLSETPAPLRGDSVLQ